MFDPARSALTGTVNPRRHLAGVDVARTRRQRVRGNAGSRRVLRVATRRHRRRPRDAKDYTASLALDPSGDRFFYVPGAHGEGPTEGTPLYAVDTRTGKQTEIVKLNDLIESKLHLTVGGSYDVAVDPSGKTVYVGLTRARSQKSHFGEVVLAVVHLP